MTIDLSTLSTSDLEKLSADIEKRKVDLEKETLKAAFAEMQNVAAKHGVRFEDVVALRSGAKLAKAKGKARYRNPADPTQTWTGKGRRPGWIMDGLAAGKDLSSFEI